MLLSDDFILGDGEDVIAAIIGNLGTKPENFGAAREEILKAVEEGRNTEKYLRYDGHHCTILIFPGSAHQDGLPTFRVMKDCGNLWLDKGNLNGMAGLTK